jgi:hypothetical protein
MTSHSHHTIKMPFVQSQSQTQSKKQTNAEELADILSFLAEMSKTDGNQVIFAPVKK